MNKNNNFDFLRFLFAIFVVISHSYPLSGGHESTQWIYQTTNGQVVLARLGLDGFFIISGFFIFQSLKRSKSLFSYYKKRFLRLFPALFVVLLLTIILAPFVYEGELPFFKNHQVYTYLPNNLSLYGFQPTIKGIFDNNPYHSINGSLWTIRYEFSLYIVLSCLYFFRKSILVKKNLLLFCFILLVVMNNFFMDRFAGSKIFGLNGYETLDLGTFFVCGSLLASFEFEKINKKRIMLLVTFLIIVTSIYLNFYANVKHIILPIIILLIGFMPLPVFSDFGKIGDMSYGIYIYSFPVQQTLMYFYKLSVFQLMFWSVLVSIVFGYLSWHLIEKKALKYKNKPLFKNWKLLFSH
ncbi:acyltransferase [Flaviramulus sp. BrNp1-15]|uniref:acyltransferase family protein n=1 Tax=Flaviramulus sp. BrNp1-15 TaxID=2916754 RepID=UPI001EE81EB8|nr:acyltransferase [Flaviramulus sp. BrNp1-15]ULC60570.1 acyltransferase [Flaviramulus sp. BrNp1-15]